jgi:uncharacterized protein YhbP (UPF0306 family)
VGGGNSWISPVAYAFDEKFNFYFASLPDSLHIKNISKNKKVAFAIFNSHQNWGEEVGLQIKGVCEKAKLIEYPKIIKLYFGRKYPFGDVNKYGTAFKKLLQAKIYFFYKIIPVKFWLNDPNSETDRRLEVKP